MTDMISAQTMSSLQMALSFSSATKAVEAFVTLPRCLMYFLANLSAVASMPFTATSWNNCKSSPAALRSSSGQSLRTANKAMTFPAAKHFLSRSLGISLTFPLRTLTCFFFEGIGVVSLVDFFIQLPARTLPQYRSLDAGTFEERFCQVGVILRVHVEADGFLKPFGVGQHAQNFFARLDCRHALDMKFMHMLWCVSSKHTSLFRYLRWRWPS